MWTALCPDVPQSRAAEIWGDGARFYGCEPQQAYIGASTRLEDGFQTPLKWPLKAFRRAFRRLFGSETSKRPMAQSLDTSFPAIFMAF